MPPTVDFSITQNIPVADHVYKYLKTRCGSDHLKATRTTFLGSFILSLQGRNADMRPKKSQYTKIFRVTIEESFYQKVGMHISPENAQLFNDQIDKMFREELYHYMLMEKVHDKKLFLKSMRQRLELYDISEDDIKLDTLYRDFKRKKEDLEKKLNLSPSGVLS